MIEIRAFAGLAHRDHGWLDTRFHFSFADYHDPDRMGWGKIRVWNDDVSPPAAGFRRTPTATWKSSLSSAPARSATRILWATPAAPAPATCR